MRYTSCKCIYDSLIFNMCAGSVKFVVRRQKMLQELGITDSLKSGTRQDLPAVVPTFLKGAEDVGGDSHFVTS